MNTAVTFILLLLSSLAGAAEKDWRNYHLVNGCSVFTPMGELIRTFPGDRCIFLPDGKFVAADLKGVRLIDTKSTVVWEVPGEFHHQLNLSHDGKRILAIGSRYVSRGKVPQFGIDRFYILGLDGTVLHDADATFLMEHIKQEKTHSETELTHFNSFHEVPEVKAPTAAYQRAGNLILNDYGNGVFILSADLRRILHHRKFAASRDHRVHDVQMLPNGNLIYFNNIVSDSPTESRYSAVQEVNSAGKLVHQFVADPPQTFFSLHMGGIQVLTENEWLISHSVAGAMVYSFATKRILRNVVETHFQRSLFRSAQQINARDLSSFLSYWK